MRAASDVPRRRLSRVGATVLLGGFVFVVGALLLLRGGAGPAAAQASGDTAAVAALVDRTERNLRLVARISEANRGLVNHLRGVGALVGLALGIAVGSIATYVTRRH